ncbi:thyroid adenoma-associated protein homolog isoform X2 [Teleopsis dalmanni]|uniref:thyroid adenoma-associated protein homolog isoform X2 n=1 Tax=Teleopsis dalmanni TaxID=139649 RepID=UPI0018CCD33C|nr:thyroid adenoma-associated protein homolog isoform X2 [Teleopsis dalmanni]
MYGEETYCLRIRGAKSVQEQVSTIKDVGKSVSKSLENDDQLFQFLADMYFHCPLKHPVRNQIVKLLITTARVGTNIDETTIIKYLTHSLQSVISNAKAKIDSCDWNKAILSLSGCFENFNCGLKSVGETISTFFPFLCLSLQKYITELGVLQSPSRRNEYYLYIHNVLRIVLSCIQEFPTMIKENKEPLDKLKIICKEILLNDEIPMDPRTNSGIILAYNAKIFDEFESFIQEAKNAKNPNEIAMCVGVINIINQKDFDTFSADIRDVCAKIDEFANSNSTVPVILLSATRALYQMSKIILTLDLSIQKTIDSTKSILRKLLTFVFGYLEHHMDSVRHMCKDLLRNILALAKNLNFEYLLEKIYNACKSERLSISMKCVILLHTASNLGAVDVLRNCPDLFSKLFSEYMGRDFMVNNLFEGMFTVSHKELEYNDWFDLWIKYLLKFAADNDDYMPELENLLVKAVKVEPKIVRDVVENTEFETPTSIKLSALWAVRKLGIKMIDFNELMIKCSCDLLYSIVSNSDESRIIALRVLVETHKTTEVLTEVECGHLLTYLEYNLNTQSPATRQKTLSLLKKVLVRLEINLVKALKECKTKEKLEKNMHYGFFVDVMRILVQNLFYGSNFSRRSVALQLFEQCLHICINLNISSENVFVPSTVPILAEMLSDCYEENKHIAVNILQTLENILGYSLVEKYKLNINRNQIKELLTSVRPTYSITGAYQLQFYCNMVNPSIFGTYELTNYQPTFYASLCWLLIELKDGLDLAKQSILQAAKLNPLYGILFAIKHLLKQLDFQILSQEIHWRIMIAELIILCKMLTAVVAPIVNSSSPEGHLPNDFSEFPAEFTKDETEINTGETETVCKVLSSKNAKLNLSTVKTTPQMVLLCSWRTIKEVSLLLGEIVLRSPIYCSQINENFLITKEQIIEIGEHFKLLLFETKHRGAFEQAYVGFSKLCCRLWRVEIAELNMLPMVWLRDLINLISKDEQINEKICATRRSAGVPFMVQALITSELQMGSTKSLHYCMSQLLQLCTPSEHISGESRTHAMNILRALFRCSDLNEAVGEFISEGVKSALRGYDAETWSEKNSATLLFAALINRIFGVQRTKDSENLNIRNKLTGRIFFLRYPKLYDFFLEELQCASSLVSMQKKANKLHPLLLLLSRLYPSALEGTESNIKLSEFIQYIVTCSGCPEFQTRFLSAKAITALISKDAVPTMILEKCADIIMWVDNYKDANLNVLHGNLILVHMLLKTYKSFVLELACDISYTLVIFQQKTEMKNSIILKAIFDILIVLLSSTTKLKFSENVMQNLTYFSTQNQMINPEFSKYFPVLRKALYVYNLHITRLTLSPNAISDSLLNLNINEKNIEQTETCLNIILLLLLKKHSNAYVMSEFEFTAHELQFVRILTADARDIIITEIKQSKKLDSILKELVLLPIYYPECTTKAYAILSFLDHFNYTLENLITESNKYPSDVKTSLAMCIERFVVSQGVDEKVSQAVLEYLTEISQPWQPDFLRFKASHILYEIHEHFWKALKNKNIRFVRSYINLLLSLIMDDDSDIRDNASNIVLKNLDVDMENVVSTMAQRLFLQAIADVLLSTKASDEYIIDIFNIITDIYSPNQSNNNDIKNSEIVTDLEVFDKNEVNVFAEPIKVIYDIIVVFKNSFNERPKVLDIVCKNAYSSYSQKK